MALPREEEIGMMQEAPYGEEGGMEIEINMAEDEDEMMYKEMAPRGLFKTKQLNNLVKATNRLLPLFGQTPDYPEFNQPINEFPVDFVRILAMFKGAIDAAVEEDVILPSSSFEMEDIKDDASVQVVAGKLSMLPQNKPFQKWLKSQEMEEGEGEEEVSGAESMMEGEAPTAEQTDAIFLERM